MKREVTRVLTPGTAADSQLGSEENNFLACVARAGNAAGFAALDLSTGEFRATEFTGDDAERRIREELLVLRPREVLFASSLPLFEQAQIHMHDRVPHPPRPLLARGWAARLPRLRAWRRWRTPAGRRRRWRTGSSRPTTPFRRWRIISACSRWKALAWRTARPRRRAAGAILHYVRTTQRGSLDHVDRIGFYERQNCLVLDAVTVRNLELIEPLFSGAGDNATLFRCLDCTVTPMGKRLLRAWMLRPSIDRNEINLRLDAVEAHGARPGRARRAAAMRWRAFSISSAC